MLDKFLFLCGVVGAFITSLFGGWSTSIDTLFIFMLLDCLTGIIDCILLKSTKTVSGGLNSKIGFLGLAKKGMILVFLLVGYRLDLVLNTNYIRDGVCISFIINELISITENATLIGFPTPGVITNVIDVIKNKEEK